MKFDKSKVFTAVNADEVKVGSKGYFADDISTLRICVEKDEQFNQHELARIYQDTFGARFITDDDISNYYFFYLVEEPKENKYRPYKDTNEMIEDFIDRYNSHSKAINTHNPMYNPLIWVKEKFDYERSYCPNSKWLIVAFDCLKVWLYDANDSYTMEELFERFTYLNGSPCGKLEE